MLIKKTKLITLAISGLMTMSAISDLAYAGRGGGGGGGGGAVVVTPTVPNWTSLLGSSTTDYGTGAAVDSLGNVAVVGYTFGSVNGGTLQGGLDSFAAMYDADGVLLWSQQTGTVGTDEYARVSFDTSGNVIAVGRSQGNIALTKFDSAGNIVWNNQYGTTGNETGADVAVDSAGNIYVCGATSGSFAATNTTFNDDAVLMKLDSNGVVQWIDQFSSTTSAGNGEDCRGLAIDASDNIVITGYTDGALVAGVSGAEFYIKKYDAAGNELWTTQRDSVYLNRPTGVAVDLAGNSYVTGSGGLDAPVSGLDDAFIVKFDAAGAEQWAVVEASAGREAFNGVAVDGEGTVHVVGDTNGALAAAGTGDTDVVHATYDSNGVQLSIVQNDTASWERGRGIAVNAAGSDFYLVGDTDANLDGETNNGAYDLFVTRNRP